MIRRNTQDPAYWDRFQVTDEDLEHLGNVLVEGEVPLSLDELARALTSFRCRREEDRIARELSRGTPYLPKNSYQEDEMIVFPAMEYAAGTVIGIREGRNPEHGTFSVIQVEFAGGKRREFAAGLAEHPLNESQPAGDEGLLSADQLYQQHGAGVQAALVTRLESSPAFIRLANRWFLKDLLVDLNEGHLNLAEAVLDMAGGGPRPTEDLVGHLDLAKEIQPQLAIFSLNYALQEDERFDEVGPAGEVLWYLRRLQPLPVLSPPPLLKPPVVEYDLQLLDETMLNLERELDDEWSDLVASPETKKPLTVVLTYPHRRSGTLPLSPRLARVFPTGRTHRIRFLFRDVNTNEEMEGWVVREHRFVYGLWEWYERYEIPIGAYLGISSGPEPGVVLIRREATRTRREWIRVATVVDGRITFEMGRYPISCKVDDRMVIAVEDLQSMDAVLERTRQERLRLDAVVKEVFPELAKLSPQGTVHASTLYSTVNVAMRTPPGPIMAVLVSDDRYIPMGDNYWVSSRHTQDY